MSSVINIDFEVFFYMVIALFGLVGFIRGWWKEAITTGLLVVLLIFLVKPEWAQAVIDAINGFIQSIFNSGAVSAAGAETPSNINPSDGQIYVIVLIVLVAASYLIGNITLGDTKVTAGGRLFGGVLGLVNGFIALSLLREYVLKRYLPNSGISAAGAVPDQVSMTVSNVPTTSITDGMGIWIMILVGLLIFFSTFWTRFKMTKGEMKKQAPPGYK